MILRIWHGYTTPVNATAYEQLLEEEVFKGIKAKNISGFKGIQLLKRDNANEVEFVTIMSFENYEAVKQFAGEDYEQSYVPAAAKKILSRFDEKAQHYELLHQLS
jgi:heme-degrading monooxygenase HmoA